MRFPFGPSLRDRSQLVRTVHALGSTSIDGLAAALSWSSRKTERLVATLARRGEGGLWYSPAVGEVRIGPPPPSPPSPVPEPGPSETPGRSTPAEPGSPGRAPTPGISAPPLPTLRPGMRKCARCGGTMELIGDHQSLVCPRCGRLARAPPMAVPESPSTGAAPAVVPPSHEDRRSQEMLAAYVSARPISCPRCHASLRHEGLGKFRCPACGSGVTFPSGAAPPLPNGMAPPAP